MSKYCKDLEFLKIKWFVNFSAPGFLVEIPKLKHLSLNYVFHLSERQLLEVVNQCTNIEVLNVTNSNLLIPYKLLEEKLYNRKINFINRAFNDKKYRQNLTFVQKTLQCPKGMNYKNCYLVINYMALSPICTHIEFVDCDLTRNAPIIALGLQACKCLVYLRFDNVELGEQGSSLITNALAQNKYLKLEHLVMLKSFPFSLENLNQLIQAFQGKELELVNMELEGELAGMQLGSFLQKSKDLVLLNLSQNPGLGNLGVKELLSGWFHTSIQLRDVIESIFTLDLSNCGIGVEGAKAISALLEVNPDLGVLKLNANNLGDEGLTELSKGIAKNHQLIHLGLQENKITDVGLIKLAQALNVQEKKRIVSNIKILDLSKNQIQQNGVLELSEALNDGSLIQELHLSGNPLLAGAIKSLTIILPTSEIEKLFLSFEEEEINTLGIEKELVDLMVESLINHRVINLGPVTSRILSLAKVNLPIRRREISKTQPSNLNLVPHKLNRQDSQKKLNNPTLFVDDNNRKSAVANFLFRKNVENL